MTGQYAWRNPAGTSILSGEAPLAIGPLKPTMASLSRGAGYTAGMIRTSTRCREPGEFGAKTQQVPQLV
jgi:hypothetical protein